MSRSKYKIYDDSFPCFITTDLQFGLPLFSIPKAVNIILDNLKFLRNDRNLKLIAYVIMENHLHAILWGEKLEDKFARFKSFSARRIIDLFVEEQHTQWLKRLKQVKQHFKKDQNYQLWEESFHPQQIFDDKMMVQKIDYIHNNPVKRGYVGKPEHWRYSSARNYAGLEGLIPIDRI